MRRLIVNADDFGLTSGINAAVVEAHERGVVTSTTLMANGPAFGSAVNAAKGVPSLAVGCHVVLLDGNPLLPEKEVSSLTCGHKNTSSFPAGLAGFAIRALSGKINPQEIEAEAVAQIRKLQDTGISVSHFDTHKHAHMFPQVLRPILNAARACGIRALRNPFPPLRELPIAVLLSRAGLWKRSMQLGFLHGFAAQFHQQVRESGLLTPDGTIGIAATGSLDEKLFRLMLETLPKGTWEFVCHPGYHDEQLQASHTRLKASRGRELEVLTSSAGKELLAREGIELISFRDLVGSGREQAV